MRLVARYDQSISTDCKDNLRVVMVSTRNPLNIGAAARAMANFGFTRLRVVNAYDVAFREARSAVGAAPLPAILAVQSVRSFRIINLPNV